jgi:hypothetical protein
MSTRFNIDLIPNYGDLMPLSDWIEMVKMGGFIDYDGHGHYSDGIQMLGDVYVKPSDVKKGNVDRRYSHIVWFNR